MTLLVQRFEKSRYPLGHAEPVEALRALMGSRDVRQRDLIPVFGSSSVASDVINGKRSISKTHARTAPNCVLRVGHSKRAQVDAFAHGNVHVRNFPASDYTRQARWPRVTSLSCSHFTGCPRDPKRACCRFPVVDIDRNQVRDFVCVRTAGINATRLSSEFRNWGALFAKQLYDGNIGTGRGANTETERRQLQLQTTTTHLRISQLSR